MIKEDCEVSEAEERLLLSPESPIVLLKRKKTNPQSAIRNPQSIAPGNPYLGAMLPYTPLHHLLMAELGFPIVATSGNLSDEPICIDECEALRRLDGVADLFLVHDRPIARHVDDSIARVMMGREMILRRARGYAPLPFRLAQKLPALLATGAQGLFSLAETVVSGPERSSAPSAFSMPRAVFSISLRS
jgi:hydrogenase maturation protein HypF